MNSYAKAVGNKLVELRRERGLLQLEAATEIGIDQTTLCCYETGRYCPKIDTAFKLANYYGVSIDWLAGISGRRDPT